MLKGILFFFTACAFVIQLHAQQEKDSSVTQTIVYKTKKAGEMYFVWGINYYEQVPPKSYLPANTFIQKSMAWSKMEKVADSFSIRLSLPKGTNINFMFWVPITPEGDSTNGWDTYNEINLSDFTQNKTLRFDDHALWMPKEEFNFLGYGVKFIVVTVLITLSLLIFFRKRLHFSEVDLIAGMLLPALVIACFVRLQLNSLVETNSRFVFGAAFFDCLFFISLAAFFSMVTFLLRKYKKTSASLLVVFSIFLLLSVFFVMINLDVVKILGRPINYQWLYYSDFLKGADAKKALAANLNRTLILNNFLFLLSISIFSVGYSFLPKSFSRKVNIGLCITASLILFVGFYQYKNFKYQKGKIENPVVELVSSYITAESSSKIFSLKIPKETENFIANYHASPNPSKYDTVGINNIILFVLESTPVDFVSVYDSTYNVTPNIKEWTNISCIYKNMYVHLPATVYSMGSLVNGIYPLISYKSLVKDYPKNPIPSLSKQLQKVGWECSLISGSSLEYSDIRYYAKESGFNYVGDDSNIKCNFGKIGNTNTALDVLDDRCLVNEYFSWSDSLQKKKRFSIIWTNQTHYPYVTNEKIEKFNKENEDLNRYLNALKVNDITFGMLMDGLRERGSLKNTLVIVLGDHGEAFGTHNQTTHASKIYEENIHIPCIFYNPVLFNGQVESHICGLIDIPATITHLTGAEKPKEWQGKSVFAKRANNRTFFICPFSDFLFGTRSENWKYIYNATLNKDELYDLSKDPKELHDVSKENPEIVKREFELVAAWAQYHRKRLDALLH